MWSRADPQSNRKSSTQLKPGLEEKSVYLQPESDVEAPGTRLYYNHLAFLLQKLNFISSSVRPQTLSFLLQCARALVPTWRKGQTRSNSLPLKKKNRIAVLNILFKYKNGSCFKFLQNKTNKEINKRLITLLRGQM